MVNIADQSGLMTGNFRVLDTSYIQSVDFGVLASSGNRIMGFGVLASYTSAVDSLKNVLLSIGTSIGAVIMVAGGIRLAIAIKNFDQNGEHTAIYSIVAGSLLIGLGALINALT